MPTFKTRIRDGLKHLRRWHATPSVKPPAPNNARLMQLMSKHSRCLETVIKPLGQGPLE